MERVILAWMVLVAAPSFSGSACAMSSPDSQSTRCRVVDGDKLPLMSGGPAALCAAIERAVLARVPGVAFSADVRVLSSSMLAATLTVEGQRLPEQRFARVDRELDGGAFERYAEALADQVAKSRQ